MLWCQRECTSGNIGGKCVYLVTVIVAGAPGHSIIIYMTNPIFLSFFFLHLFTSQIKVGSSNCLCKFPLQKKPLGGAENQIQETGS